MDGHDVIIIGAGPSGLFCAININNDKKYKKILLLEKNNSAGKKLLITGSGQCNITHEGAIKSFLRYYGEHGRFLRPALLNFTNMDLMEFFETRKLSMITYKNGKIFPETLRSADVLNILLKECQLKNVDLRYNEDAKTITKTEHGFEIVSKDHTYKSKIVVIATGGRSYPATGSTGDGYYFASKLGHTITEISPALTPVLIKSYPFGDLAGISFENTNISLYRDEKKLKTHRGDVLLTHHGLSGPGILDFSRDIRAGDTLKLSFVPENQDEFGELLIQKLQSNGNKKLRKILKECSLPERLIPKILELTHIPPELKCAHLTKTSRNLLLDKLTNFPLIVKNLGNFNLAVVTKGGVDLNEINSKTMESKLVRGLYFIGEILDIDGDTGGYNIQAAFSAAMLAAKNISKV